MSQKLSFDKVNDLVVYHRCIQCSGGGSHMIDHIRQPTLLNENGLKEGKIFKR